MTLQERVYEYEAWHKVVAAAPPEIPAGALAALCNGHFAATARVLDAPASNFGDVGMKMDVLQKHVALAAGGWDSLGASQSIEQWTRSIAQDVARLNRAHKTRQRRTTRKAS
ncbi:MAG: hypothetical protein IT537_30570 [Hyphomicrobiales bacterium]|nr:hypothetical protein [Hyphomicrobiales bacterium]